MPSPINPTRIFPAADRKIAAEEFCRAPRPSASGRRPYVVAEAIGAPRRPLLPLSADGDGTAAPLISSSVTLDLLGLAPAQQFWIYGRIPGRQLTAVPGLYVDALSVTVTYY